MDQATIPGQHLKQNCQDLAENRLPDSLLFITKAEVNLSVKDPTPLFSRSGVYLLECDECSSKYVGQTGRALDSRVKEHEGEIRSIQKRLNKRRNNEDFSDDDQDCKSSFSAHIAHSGHAFNRDKNVSLLHKCNKGRKLDLLEAIEIQSFRSKNNVNLVNDVLFSTSNLIITRLYKTTESSPSS